MRKVLTLAAVLVVVAMSRADERISAPVPKTPPAPSIDGKYTLLATSDTVVTKGGTGGIRPTALRSETVITKNEITIEGRTLTAAPTTMEYTLDTTKSPMTIDVDTISLRGKKTRSLGVVEVSGNRLTIALARDGAERPKSTDEADGVTVYYFQKAPPPPRFEYRIVAMTVGQEEAAEKELNKLAQDGYELVNTTNPAAPNDKAAPTTVHFVLKRTVKAP